MTEVEQIVEDILIENDIDFDHPVVPFLFEDVEQALDEISDNKLNSYVGRAARDKLTAVKDQTFGDKSWKDRAKKHEEKRGAGLNRAMRHKRTMADLADKKARRAKRPISAEDISRSMIASGKR